MKEKLKMLIVMLVLAALVFLRCRCWQKRQDGQEAVLLDLTKLAQAIISLAAGIVSLYLVPWLRSKLTNEQLSEGEKLGTDCRLRSREAIRRRQWRPEAGICGGFSASTESGSTRRRLKR